MFRRWNQMGQAHYQRLGVESHAVPVRVRPDADERSHVEAVRSASMVFFSGGDPGHLRRTLLGSDLLRAIVEMVSRGGVYGGCSAGAMVVGEPLEDGAGITARALGHGL